LSEKTNKILELSEKLLSANETIQILEERITQLYIPLEPSPILNKQISEIRAQDSSEHLSEHTHSVD